MEVYPTDSAWSKANGHLPFFNTLQNDFKNCHFSRFALDCQFTHVASLVVLRSHCNCESTGQFERSMTVIQQLNFSALAINRLEMFELR